MEKTQSIHHGGLQPNRKSQGDNRNSRDASRGHSNNREKETINMQQHRAAARKKSSQTELNLMKKTSMTSLKSNNEKSAE